MNLQLDEAFVSINDFMFTFTFKTAGDFKKRFLVCSHLCLFLVYVFENLADFPQLKMKSTQR